MAKPSLRIYCLDIRPEFWCLQCMRSDVTDLGLSSKLYVVVQYAKMIGVPAKNPSQFLPVVTQLTCNGKVSWFPMNELHQYDQ